MATAVELREAQQFLKENGYQVDITFHPSARAQWYRADGTPLPQLLPLDPYFIQSFRKKGWTLTPPSAVAPVLAAAKKPLTREERAAISRTNMQKAREARRAKQEAKHV